MKETYIQHPLPGPQKNRGKNTVRLATIPLPIYRRNPSDHLTNPEPHLTIPTEIPSRKQFLQRSTNKPAQHGKPNLLRSQRPKVLVSKNATSNSMRNMPQSWIDGRSPLPEIIRKTPKSSAPDPRSEGSAQREKERESRENERRPINPRSDL